MQVLLVNARLRQLTVALVALIATAVHGDAAPDPRQGDIGTLQIGMSAATMPTDPFTGFGCGTNGGPAGLPLSGWSEYSKCPADKVTKLHEVDFQFDDELHYLALARGDTVLARKFDGRRLAGFPVIMSALFDDTGTVKGFRIVTDNRTDLSNRGQAFLLGKRMMIRYGQDGWICRDEDLTNGETPIGRTAIKRACAKSYANHILLLQVHLFRHAGQYGMTSNPREAATPGQFESSTRMEIYAPDVAIAPQWSALVARAVAAQVAAGQGNAQPPTSGGN
jgi:hypothetical protein